MIKITEEMITLAIKLKACPEGIKRGRRGLEFLTWEDKIWIAWQKEAPAEILTILSKDVNCLVRHRVAYNTSTPAHVLKKLSRDEDNYIRVMAFNNPSFGRIGLWQRLKLFLTLY